jgi:hypothetical protein
MNKVPMSIYSLLLTDFPSEKAHFFRGGMKARSNRACLQTCQRFDFFLQGHPVSLCSKRLFGNIILFIKIMERRKADENHP